MLRKVIPNSPKIQKYGLTFDDVLLIPGRASIMPRDVDVKTKFSRNISINIPICSAAMDTVTESRLAIAIAQEGGIGVIHKNLTIAEQAKEVDKVKRSESGMILDPVTLTPESTVYQAAEAMNRYNVSGFPVVEGKKLVGILTNRDLRFVKNKKQKVKELMTPKERLITATHGISLEKAQEILHKNRIEKLPVVNKDFELKGLITIKDIEKKLKHPYAAKDKFGRLMVAAAVGPSDEMNDRAQALINAGVDALVVDTAHGHSDGVIEAVRELKRKFPSIDILGGNIATEQAAKDLIKVGADGLKVGMGPGSICTTRIIAGIGVPQISAVMDVYKVAKKSNVPVIADGGIKYSGDITKAIAAGADSVMIGSLFAGTEESPGETVLLEGRSFKVHRGMGSLAAMKKRGGRERYFQWEEDEEKLVPEGIEGRVPFRGPLSSSVIQLIGGLRAGMGYCGVRNIRELKSKTQFVQISNAGLKESHPHDIIITNEAPNYRIMK
ncbi:MAG TPA: IMP dehydrogenase [Candidatus Goldiibacteriota bacterium]|nr:IMP dehydrogenase [Candidatus Goldiibacteriota bacterium]